MQFIRGGHSDDRRRRVLQEELADDDASSGVPVVRSARSKTAASGSRYSATARRENQLRVSDLVPKKLTHLVLVFALLAVGSAAPLVAYERLSHVAATKVPAALELDGEGNLVSAVQSGLLLLAAALALVVYSLRRHRVDDYGARYRIWVVAAVLWLLMSLDEAGSLHESIGPALGGLAAKYPWLAGPQLWIGFYIVAGGAILARLLLEMRECRPSTTALSIGLGCFGAALLLAETQWLPIAGTMRLLAEEACELAGDWLVVLAMCLHARHVALDVEGLLPKRKQRSTKAKTTAAATKPASTADSPLGKRRSDLESSSAASTLSYSARASVERFADEDEEEEEETKGRKWWQRSGQQRRFDDAEDGPPERKLSKSQRKAMRREKERQRREY